MHINVLQHPHLDVHGRWSVLSEMRPCETGANGNVFLYLSGDSVGWILVRVGIHSQLIIYNQPTAAGASCEASQSAGAL